MAWRMLAVPPQHVGKRRISAEDSANNNQSMVVRQVPEDMEVVVKAGDRNCT